MTHSSMWECCEDAAVNEYSLEKDCKRKRADNLEEASEERHAHPFFTIRVWWIPSTDVAAIADKRAFQGTDSEHKRFGRSAGSGSDIIGAKPEATQSRGEPEFSQSADATAGQRQAQKSPGVSTAAAALESGYTGRQKTATKKKDDGGKEKERCIATDRHWP
ncbi:hypothetical protein DFH06DRAFT_1132650 [Mycena polygramma]|nr:hypothetical protein DFH06DRAFT_1132650 [Mycena polygramma]